MHSPVNNTATSPYPVPEKDPKVQKVMLFIFSGKAVIMREMMLDMNMEKTIPTRITVFDDRV